MIEEREEKGDFPVGCERRLELVEWEEVETKRWRRRVREWTDEAK